MKPRLSFYELNNGDVLTSLSGREYVINAYAFESSMSELIARLIPRRNLERKAINCQPLEVPDLSACNAQLIVFKSELDRLPELAAESLLEYIGREADLSVFNRLVQFCGNECKSLLANLTAKQFTTILMPTNVYFSKALYNFQRFSSNLTLFKRTIQANVFSGAYCGFYLRHAFSIENKLGRKVKSTRILSRIAQTDVFMSKSGLIAHKVDEF